MGNGVHGSMREWFRGNLPSEPSTEKEGPGGAQRLNLPQFSSIWFGFRRKAGSPGRRRGRTPHRCQGFGGCAAGLHAGQ
jgi:hypothetical protein